MKIAPITVLSENQQYCALSYLGTSKPIYTNNPNLKTNLAKLTKQSKKLWRATFKRYPLLFYRSLPISFSFISPCVSSYFVLFCKKTRHDSARARSLNVGVYLSFVYLILREKCQRVKRNPPSNLCILSQSTPQQLCFRSVT